MLTTCGTASWRKISNVFASKRTFRGLRTYEGKITLHKTSLSLFEARVTYFRRLASVSPRKLWHPRTVWCDIVQYCTVWSGRCCQVFPGIAIATHSTRCQMPCFTLHLHTHHHPPSSLPRYETMPEAPPDDRKVVRKLVRRAIRNLVRW